MDVHEKRKAFHRQGSGVSKYREEIDLKNRHTFALGHAEASFHSRWHEDDPGRPVLVACDNIIRMLFLFAGRLGLVVRFPSCGSNRRKIDQS